ncbi:hypothetical protein [Alkalithermobacter paradoxus]|uniref:Uncharacterized protein n=1 Tax=Alkalithermobacter paradoxus TaxID=29349 RepID=A0A1V4IBC5_9FIRM|nr:hypothetical protein CLOTH_05090 [[Clostridium] thermoalcaliphilum]
MGDVYLLNKIDTFLKEICTDRNIKKINQMSIVVSKQSHIHEANLHEHLKKHNVSVIGDWTSIDVKKDEIPPETAIVTNIEVDYE